LAIVQVSRITNRKGLQENLPQLAGAELGWAIDDRRLYIGNGTLQEGAPVIGNTEILTEFSDVLALSRGYTYQGAAAGYVVQTGPSSGSPITQTIQNWMDQWASVKDFGATGDGITDDTEAINRALYQLYCRETNTQIRRSLFFPAGRYLVSESIIIPSYARIYGEGANSSVIVMTSSDISTLSEYCARFGDSLQQIGNNIGNNGATPPTNIEISSMGFYCDYTTDVFAVEDASFCTFTDVSFSGPLTQADLTTSIDDTRCVSFKSTPILITNNITFRRCEFTGCTYAIYTYATMKGVVITESRFDTLFQGVNLGAGPPGAIGPTGVRLTANSFDNIYAQAFQVATNSTLNASGYNIFYDVGNHFNGATNPATDIISFASANNVSIGDMFERTDADSTVHARIYMNGKSSIGINSGTQTQQGTYIRQSGILVTLLNNVSNTTLFTQSASVVRAFQINYTIIRDSGLNKLVKTGTFTVVSSTDGTGADLSFNDNSIENSSTGVTIDAVETAGVVTVRYSTTNTGVTARLSYSVTYLD
jgi:hypothetical protein